MDFKTFKTEFKKIKKLGFVKTTKKVNRNGGQGNTLEDLLGISENNISAPDLGDIELKTTNISDGSVASRLISLFTFNNKVWKIDQLEAIEKYGSLNKDGRMGMYYTLTTKPNSQGLFIWLEEVDRIQVRNIDGTILLDYPVMSVVDKFNNKLEKLILVYSEREERDGVYYYRYTRGKYFYGGTNKEIIMQFLKENRLTIDLRLHPKTNSITGDVASRNHGTGFRIKEKDIVDLYEMSEEL